MPNWGANDLVSTSEIQGSRRLPAACRTAGIVSRHGDARLAASDQRQRLSGDRECDRVGREPFLEDNGFKEAREYFLIHDGRAYDSKAIAGVAYGYVTPIPLRSGDFTGGVVVAEVLRRLGFHVTGAADWAWPELLLAGALLVENGWQRTLRAHETKVAELSRFLRDRNPEFAMSPTFRSPNSVQRKLEDMRTSRRDYQGAKTRGGQLTVQVVRAFEDDPDRMLALASLIRGRPDLAIPEIDDDSTTTFDEEVGEGLTAAIEGRVARRLVTTRERDPKLRAAKLRAVRAAGRAIACEVCDFDFGTSYGSHGDGYIQVHHVLPLHVSGEVKTELKDLVLLCANCHVMIHHGKVWKTPAELRALLSRNG